MARMRSTKEVGEEKASETDVINDEVKQQIEMLKNENQLARDQIQLLKSETKHYRVLFYACLLIICVGVGKYFGSQTDQDFESVQAVKFHLVNQDLDELKQHVEKEKEEVLKTIEELRTNQMNIQEKVKEVERWLITLFQERNTYNIERVEQDLDEFRRQGQREKEDMKYYINRIHDMQITDRVNVENLVRAMQDWGEFVWPIDDWTAKMQSARDGNHEWEFSAAFYSHKNGYKLCLSVWPDGYGDGKGTHLGVYFHLMSGVCNDILTWPFNRSVTLSVINQHTGIDHVSHTTLFDQLHNNTDVNKPTVNIDRGLGTNKLIPLAALSSNTELCKNDRIFIRCTIK